MNNFSEDYSIHEYPANSPTGYPSNKTSSTLKKPSKPTKQTNTVTGKIFAIRFINDHKKLRDAKASFASEGTPYPKPEWIVNAVNSPVTFSRNQRIRVTIAIKVEPIGEIYKIIGDGGRDYLYFEKDNLFSIGYKQYIFSLRAKSKLPKKISYIYQKIKWYIIGNFGRVELGSSGPHEIFVLWGPPIETGSRSYSNKLTYKRIKFLTSNKVSGGKGSIDQIAKSIYKVLNHQVINTVKWKAPDPPYTNGSQFWAILDGGNKSQCFEGSTLMELMVRLLGIPAVQKHVLGATKFADIDKKVAFGKHIPDPESRKCYAHFQSTQRKEKLAFLYGTSFQWGQGCCEVNKKVYAVFVKGDIIGTKQGKRTSVHHVLLQLENIWKKEVSKKFLVWTDSGKSPNGTEWTRECLAPAKGKQGPPAPSVPPVPK